MAIATTIKFDDPSNCPTLYYFCGGLMLAFALLVTVTAPHRVPFDDFMNATLALITALLAFSQASATFQVWTTELYTIVLALSVSGMLVWILYPFVDDWLMKKELALAEAEIDAVAGRNDELRPEARGAAYHQADGEPDDDTPAAPGWSWAAKVAPSLSASLDMLKFQAPDPATAAPGSPVAAAPGGVEAAAGKFDDDDDSRASSLGGVSL